MVHTEVGAAIALKPSLSHLLRPLVGKRPVCRPKKETIK